MVWFRHYEGLVTDPKLHRIARNLSTKRHMIVAAWCSILEYASGERKGSIEGLDAPTLAYMTDCSTAKSKAILAAFLAAGIIDSDRVTAWGERQFQSDSSQNRVKKHRQKKAEHEANAKKPDEQPTDNEQNSAECNVTLARDRDQARSTESESYSKNVRDKGSLTPSQASPARQESASDLLADPAKAMLRSGRQMLTKIGRTERQADALIGRWRKAATDEGMIGILSAAHREQPSDPVAWIEGAIKHRQGKPYTLNGKGRASVMDVTQQAIEFFERRAERENQTDGGDGDIEIPGRLAIVGPGA